jgi:hypothetical protein
MTKLFLSASVSALVLAGVGSFAAAQTSSSDTGLQQTSVPDFTCAHIAGLDATSTLHVLYYIKGFLAGQKESSSGAAAAPSTTGGSAPAAASGTTTGTDTAASGSAIIPGTGTAAGAENQAATEAVAGPGLVSGWSDIKVEQVVADCRADSSASLSSILEKQAN